MKPASPEAFFEKVRDRLFHGYMSQSQVDGANAILAAWPDDIDPRIGAYGLATPFWETDFTMQPVAEIGRGRRYAYGRPAGPYNQVYYGRGYVQVTWLHNYQRADTELHGAGTLAAGQSLVRTPDLALVPTIAAPIMVRGMLEGWFGPKIELFFTSNSTDFYQARRNINGLDHADEIAQIAEEFLSALTAVG